MTIREKCALAQKASPALAQADAKTRNGAILKMAQYLRESADELLAANETDMRSAGVNGVPEAMLDRLRLTPARIEGIAAALEELAQLADPLGGGEVWRRPNGLEIKRVHVPLGVIGDHLRVAPERDGGRRGALCEERQRRRCCAAARRPSIRILAIVSVLQARAGRRRPRQRRAGHQRRTPSRETATELMRHERICRSAHPARRRGAYPLGGGERHGAGHRDRRRKLPRLCGKERGFRDGRARSSATPKPRGRRSATRCETCAGRPRASPNGVSAAASKTRCPRKTWSCAGDARRLRHPRRGVQAGDDEFCRRIRRL